MISGSTCPHQASPSNLRKAHANQRRPFINSNNSSTHKLSGKPIETGLSTHFVPTMAMQERYINPRLYKINPKLSNMPSINVPPSSQFFLKTPACITCSFRSISPAKFSFPPWPCSRLPKPMPSRALSGKTTRCGPPFLEG